MAEKCDTFTVTNRVLLCQDLNDLTYRASICMPTADVHSDKGSDGDAYTPQKGSATVKYGSKGRKPLLSEPGESKTRPASARKSNPVTAAVGTRPRSRALFSDKKRTQVPSRPKSVDPDDSELSPPPPSPTFTRLPRNALSSSKSHAAAQPSPSLARTSAPQASSSSVSKKLLNAGDEPWSVTELGTYVWVLLDKRARVFDLDDVGDGKDRLWWPGQITSSCHTDVPLVVSLFGDAAPGIYSIEIHNPSARNILPLANSRGGWRYDHIEFATSSFSSLADDIGGSPRKKYKVDWGDTEERWLRAIACVMADDELPPVGLLHHPTVVPLSKGSPKKSVEGKGKPFSSKGKRKRKVDSDSEDRMDVDLELDPWTPPLPDENLQIPGEMVLACEGSGSRYWPAKILQYIPPTAKKRGEGKYQVEYLDSTEGQIPRSKFFTADEDGFATCKLGKWDSEVNEVVNDNDNEEVSSADKNYRSPSPVPEDPPPSEADFVKLDIRQQFVYTKTVLRAVLNGEYEPARKNHDRFIGGGGGRKSVVNEAGLRGKMDPNDVSKLQIYVSEWCLRDEGRARVIMDEGGEVKGHPEITNVDSLPVEEATDILKSADGLSTIVKTSEASLTEEVNSSACPSDVDVPFPSSSPYGDDILTERADSPPASLVEASELAITVPSIEDLAAPCEAIENIPAQIDETNLDSSKTQEHCEPHKSPRQRGCDAYEALAGVEKIDYCLNVLLPEAILQILTWRSGDRRSLELLSPAEEGALHKKGEKLMKETDWVFDVMRLRTSKRRLLDRQVQRTAAAVDERGGGGSTRTRPRRSVGTPRYHE